MKWKRTALMTVLLLAVFTAGAFAASQIERVEAFIRHDFQLIFNGMKTDVGNILIHDGKSYLPVASVAELLNIDASYDNKTIYLNERFQNQPEPVGDSDPDTDSITLVYTVGYQAKYLGKESPVFAVVTMDNVTYYRDADIRRLGINTSGLRKARDTITKELYVTEKELATVWTTKPSFSAHYGVMVIGETDPDKLDVLENFIEGLPVLYEQLYKDDDVFYYYPVPQVVLIDASPDNEYRILTIENDRYVRYKVTLKQNILDKWYTAGFSTENLGSPYSYYSW